MTPPGSRLCLLGFAAAFSAGFLALLLALLGPSVFGGRHLSSADLLADHAPWSLREPLSSVKPEGQHSDPVFFFEPWQRYAARQVRAGTLPLRNPSSSLGAPFLANAQSALLSPFTAPFYLLPERVAAWVSALAKMLLAGLGTALLARQLGRSRLAAAIAGGAYGLCGFTVLWLTYPLASALVPLPWALLGVRLLGERPRLGVPTLALAMAISVLGGHPECAFHAGFVAFLFLVLEICLANPGSRWPLARRFGGAALLAGLLAAPQILPFIDYVVQSGAWAARTDATLRATRLAHPPALPSFGGAVLFAALLFLAHALLSAAHAHPRRLEALSPGLRRHPAVRGADFLMAGLAGVLMALFARSCLEAGAWNLFPLLLDPHFFGVSDFAVGADRYAGPVFFVEVNGGYLGAAAVLLAFLAPALCPDDWRRARFRFFLAGFLVFFLIAADAPPFSQLLFMVPPFDVIVNRRLLGVSALCGALVAAYAIDGLRFHPTGGRRAALQTLLALGIAVAGTVWTYDPAELPDRTGAKGVPETLPAQLGDPVSYVTRPLMHSTVRGSVLPVEGFAIAREPLEEVVVRLTSVVDGGKREVTAAVGLPEPRPLNSILRRYPESERSGFATRVELGDMPAGSAHVDVLLRTAAGERLLCRRTVRIERPRGLRLALFTVPAFLIALGLATSRRRAWQRAGLAALIALIGGDLFAFAREHIPQIPAAHVYPSLDDLEEVLRDPLLRFTAPVSVFPPNTHLAYGLHSISGRDVLERDLHKQLLTTVAGRRRSPVVRALGLDPTHPLFPFLGVHRMLLPEAVPIAAEEGRVLQRSGGLQVVEPLAEPVRARFYRRWQRRRVEETAFEHLQRAAADPLRLMVLDPETADDLPTPRDGDPAEPRPDDSGAEVPVQLRFDRPQEIEVEVGGSDAGWLLVTDLHSPHFRAEVDGQPARVARAFDAFLAVQVPAGDGSPRTVRILYAPWTFRSGVALAILGALLLFGYLLLGLRRSRVGRNRTRNTLRTPPSQSRSR